MLPGIGSGVARHAAQPRMAVSHAGDPQSALGLDYHRLDPSYSLELAWSGQYMASVT